MKTHHCTIASLVKLLRVLAGLRMHTTTAAAILLHLYERKTATVGELAALAGITSPSAVGLIRRMVKEGWLLRLYLSADRRTLGVGISAGGRFLIDSALGDTHDPS